MGDFSKDYIAFKVKSEEIEKLSNEQNIDFWATIKMYSDRCHCELVKSNDGYILKNDPENWLAAGTAILMIWDIPGFLNCFTECLYYEQGKFDCDYLSGYCKRKGIAYGA